MSEERQALKLSEGFYSVQAEGVTTGIPAYFVRLEGCNLICGGPGGSLVEKPDVYRLASPLYHLDETDPPIAFITGELDDISTRADKFREEAEKMGVTTRFMIIKDAPHNFIKDPEWFDIAINWATCFLQDNLNK